MEPTNIDWEYMILINNDYKINQIINKLDWTIFYKIMVMETTEDIFEREKKIISFKQDLYMTINITKF
jgi:pullulanase/glycogen debranching enzyme